MSVLKYKDPQTGEWKQAGAVKVIGISDAVVEPLEVAENGTYTPPDGVTGFAPVVVDVQPNIQPLTITENGTYQAEDGVDGYSPITVEVAASGGGDSLEGHFDGSLTEITLPNITRIKAYCFSNHTTLASITMPNVESIGNYAFDKCSALRNLTMPKIKTIGQYAFRALNIATLELPEGLTEVSSYGFYQNKATDLILPSTLDNLGYRSFGGCSSLATVTFRGTPTSISSCFDNSTNLTTINVPWAEGAVANAPWGATNATINYNYTGD